MDIRFKIEGLNELTEELRYFPKELARANRNAANTTATAIGKLGVDEAFKVYNVKVKARLKEDSRGRKMIYIQKARQGEASAAVTFKGGDKPTDGTRIGLQHFKIDKREKNIKERGWTPHVKIKRSGKTMPVKNGFYGVGKLEGQGIFQRQIGRSKTYRDRRRGTDRKGEMIIRQTGPNLKQMLEDRKVWREVRVQAEKIYEQKLLAAVDKQIKKMAR